MLMEYLGVKDHIQNLILSNIRIATLSDRFLNCLAIAEKYITIHDTIRNEMFAVLCESIMRTMCTVLESAIFEDQTRMFIILYVAFWFLNPPLLNFTHVPSVTTLVHPGICAPL